MHAYIDTSVLLRKLLAEPEPLEGLERFRTFVASELLRVECLRTLDRLRLGGVLGDEELAGRCQVLYEALKRIELVRVSRAVLETASRPHPTRLGTLDALHLATALLWQKERKTELVMLTHDRELGLASRALGLEVLGC